VRLARAAVLFVLFGGAVVDARPSAPVSVVVLHGRDAAGLEVLLRHQRDPGSSEFGHWLSPQEFGRRFGSTARGLKGVSRWLRARGCRVRRFPGRQLVGCAFSGAVGDVPPDIRRFITGVLTPEVSSALHTRIAPVQLQPLSIVSGALYLSPAEFARVYDLDPVLTRGIDGTGQRIGIVAISAINPSDVALFRSFFSLPVADLVVTGAGDIGGAAEIEALLDATWSGAVAPGAQVVVAAGVTGADALGYLVGRGDISVISISLGLCGNSPVVRLLVRAFYRLFRQAAAEGQSVFVASGDTGPLTCLHRMTDRFASSPLVTAVGGTMPSPTLDQSGLATGYGSEAVWAEGTAASGGGVSRLRRPAYQKKGQHRTVPDVAFPASDVYPLGYMAQVRCCVGGTSAAAPTWAGVAALLNQQLGRRAGPLNPQIYRLGRAQSRGGAAVFHDITVGSNSVTGTTGFAARPGYDLATGWGTIDGNAFLGAFGGP
jgi:subtilase family serine protease